MALRSEEEVEEDDLGTDGPEKRGAKKIPELWSRVISIFSDDLQQIQIYQTATDLLLL